LTEDLKQMKS